MKKGWLGSCPPQAMDQFRRRGERITEKQRRQESSGAGGSGTWLVIHSMRPALKARKCESMLFQMETSAMYQALLSQAAAMRSVRMRAGHLRTRRGTGKSRKGGC